MTATLARYRLRPVLWGRLAGLAAGWFLATWALVDLLGDPMIGVKVFQWAAFLVGLGGTVLAAPETDPPRAVLRAEPVPLWRTLALRLAGWLALGAAPILALAVLLDGLGGWTAADLTTGTLAGYLLVTASGFLAGARASVLGGGATAMAVLVGMLSAGRTWPAWFPVQLDSGPGDPRWLSSHAWMVGLSLTLVAAALVAERRTDAPLGLPDRRATTQPNPRSEAQVRP
jgi:hypothetical protein